MPKRTRNLPRLYLTICLALAIGSIIFLLIPNKQRVYVGDAVAKTKCYQMYVPNGFNVTQLDTNSCTMELTATDGSYSVAVVQRTSDANATDAGILQLAKGVKVANCSQNKVDQPAAGVLHIDWSCATTKMDMYAFHGAKSKLGAIPGQPKTALWLGVVNLKPKTVPPRADDIYQRLRAI